MDNRIYVDTNIFIDLLDSSRPLASGSFEVLQTFMRNGKELFMNSDTITNAYYVCNKTKKYEHSVLVSLLEKVVSLFTVVGIDNSEVMEALHLCGDDTLAFKDYEDALQYVCAKKVEADLIVTNDKGFVSLDIELKGTK